MTARHVLLLVALVVTSVLVQVTVLARLPLPVVAPDLLLVVVVAAALVEGPLRGSVLGFAAGLTADLMPPADHTLGRLALAYAVIGYLAGLLEDTEERSALAAVVVVGLASAAGALVYAGIGALVGDPRVSWDGLAKGLPLLVLYDVILAPFVVPLVTRALRHVDDDVAYR